MTLKGINQMIEALEQSSCTFSNCEKLASLYICRKYFKEDSKNTQERCAKHDISEFIFL